MAISASPSNDPATDLMLNRQLYGFTLKPEADPQCIQNTIEQRQLTNEVVWVLPQGDGHYSLSATAKAARIFKMLPQVDKFWHVCDSGAETRRQMQGSQG